ncbi:pseudouridine synthase [Chitinophaga barathri]|uniref:Pseudouridine synthase n=1 Tax=Chitinophaga barathri TaxID=1647451 RepID=A0A3N4MC74_9BACT|nr:pseudouridine synthase [Chitinophaga barathri]RPD39067.1 pseudouridine synthase [Chitinophaga barathri]
MKKSRPAPRKGFTPFKENKTGKPSSERRPKKDGEDSPRGRSDEKGSYKSFRDNRSGSGDDKPKRSFGDKEFKPRKSFGDSEDRPKRSFGDRDDKPKRSFGDKEFKPRKSFGDGEDRPKRSFGDRDDKPKRSFGDKEFKPRKSFGDDEDRPKRSFGDRDDKPKRSFGDKEFKPRKSFGDGEDRPKRSFGDRDDKPKRSFGDKEFKPRKSFGDDEDRPKRSFGDGEDRPKRKFEDREDRPKKDKDKSSDRPRKSERKAEIHGKKKEKSTRKRIIKETATDESSSNEMPLNKFISHCGICSRRKAVDYIKEGQVTVNGEKIVEPAFKVTAKDEVKLNDKRIYIQKNLIYVLLNKPKGYITTTDDPEGRQTVMELVEDAADEERLFPVGRLDRNTSGLLLLTNDGELAQKLAHPKHNIKKIYHVELDKPLTKADFDQIISGVTLEDGLALVDALGYVDTKDKKQVGIEIHSGKNRIVRRIFEHLEYKVEKLDRVMYAGLTKKNVNRGKWRFLTEKEVILLKHFK